MLTILIPVICALYRGSFVSTKSQPVLFSGTHFCFISIAYKHLVMVTVRITLSLGGKCLKPEK